MTQFTVPGLTEQQGAKIVDLLQKQLSTYNDLHLTLKHVHWNVVGPSFIGVHEMIDPQVELVRGYADEVAERIATLGGSPQGTPGAILKDRTWDDYSVGRDTVPGPPGCARTWSTTASSRTPARESAKPRNSTRLPRTF